MKSHFFLFLTAVVIITGCNAGLPGKSSPEITNETIKTLPLIVAPADTAPTSVIRSKEVMEINRLIDLLNSDDWHIREDATRDLYVIYEGIGRESLDIVNAEVQRAVLPEVKLRLETIREALKQSFDNMLKNPSFESEFTDWKYVENWNGSKIQLIKAEKGSAPDGNFFIEMWHDPARGVKPGSSSWSACGQYIREIVKPEVTYFVSFWYCTTDPYGFRIATSDEALVMHSGGVISVSEPVADGKWHKVTGMFSRTEEQLFYEPYLTLYYDYSAPGTVWFDAVTMVQRAFADKTAGEKK
ncbi:MAG: hypothetical protein HZA48_11835 [Planctomycetes bacterium]|nr:hypothetical protein [Planctomycetota bacterium]